MITQSLKRVSIGLAICAGTFATGAIVLKEQASAQYDYSRDGQISLDQIETVREIVWPQTYDGIISLLGYPRKRSECCDYYLVPDWGWLVVRYDSSFATAKAVDYYTQYFPLEPVPKERYGSGLMTADQLATLQWLAWPQTAIDMTGSFGSPRYRTETADYYEIPDGKWAAIWYQDDLATGYSVQAHLDN